MTHCHCCSRMCTFLQEALGLTPANLPHCEAVEEMLSKLIIKYSLTQQLLHLKNNELLQKVEQFQCQIQSIKRQFNNSMLCLEDKIVDQEIELSLSKMNAKESKVEWNSMRCFSTAGSLKLSPKQKLKDCSEWAEEKESQRILNQDL